MKNKVLLILIGGLLLSGLIVVPVVYAANTNSTENGSTVNKNADKIALAREKRVLIKTQKAELAQLREELKTQIALKQTELNQYREKEELNDEERESIEETAENLERLQVKLGHVYGNAIQAMKSYKGDTSENKLTGLDLVIASQQERITLLEEAIELLD